MLLALARSAEGIHSFTSTVVDFGSAILQAFAEEPFLINLILHYLRIVSSGLKLQTASFIKIKRRLVDQGGDNDGARDIRTSGDRTRLEFMERNEENRA